MGGKISGKTSERSGTVFSSERKTERTQQEWPSERRKSSVPAILTTMPPPPPHPSFPSRAKAPSSAKRAAFLRSSSSLRKGGLRDKRMQSKRSGPRLEKCRADSERQGFKSDALDGDLVNLWASSLGDDGAPAVNRSILSVCLRDQAATALIIMEIFMTLSEELNMLCTLDRFEEKRIE
ncbi:hypothetical protein STAS_22286 [Striga asiatica]|uniref:Uncharacterized protein n=1 Tax=Striga asiatica TaxID=4170 RepID=A0A5A7QJ54_STRAF|nr:hypothetical protein STAS_22286 [Striga asiatica]